MWPDRELNQTAGYLSRKMNLCKVCLVGDIKMYPMTCSIIELYEKLTDTKLSPFLGPHNLCYICHSLLQRNLRFKEMASSSEYILNDLTSRGLERTYKNILLIYPDMKPNLSRTCIQITSYKNNDDNSISPIVKDPIAVKDEIAMDNEGLAILDTEPIVILDELAIVKEEPTIEQSFSNYQYIGNEIFDHKPTLKETNYNEGYGCNGCKKVFKSKNILFTHLRNYHSNCCLVCFKKFSEKTSLKKHMRIHTGERPFPCLKCNKRFTDNFSLKKHMRTHTGEKPYACSKCNKKFSDKSNLTNHMRTHTGERPYECNECDKKFAESSSLTKHMRTHTGEKPYSCVECNKTFSAKYNLTIHLRTHTGLKPFSCTECDGTFLDRSRLNKHMKCHSREKPLGTYTGPNPFSCTECDGKFLNISRLNRHMKCHSSEKPFGCNICDAKFSRKCHAKVHMERHSKRMNKTQNADCPV